jgi:hypothetical protein
MWRIYSNQDPHGVVEMRREDAVIAAVPALTLPLPDAARLLQKLILILLSILTPPPDPLMDVRHRLCAPEPALWRGRDVFRLFSAHMYSFVEITRESPGSFLEIVRNVSAFQRRANHARHILSQENWAHDLVEMLPYLRYAICII